jgi:lysophospholipase L1-like esterase
MYLNDMTMKSVACSGAVTGDMNGNGKYLGQNNRLNSPLFDTQGLIDEARSDNIPGRIRQIDFVKKYQPAVITLTAGGNDVHFSDVIKSCVLSPFFTCAYAHSDEGKAIIALDILSLYDKLVKLYTDIHAASPKTKIYVVGYPQFVSDRDALLCAPNVVLNDAERTMVHESVIYINKVIEAAVNTVGVKYLDIEDSLGGHALCGGQQAYVTGLAARGELGIFSLGSKSEKQESFHPNAKGNKTIAGAIQTILGEGETLLSYDYCPSASATICVSDKSISVEPPAYFADALKHAVKKYVAAQLTVDDYVQKQSDLSDFTINFSGLEPGSNALLEVHSNPMSLGTYTVDEAGYLSVNVPIPDDLPAGYHTLHLIGKTVSGEDIDFWQIIEVRGRAGDIDEDGVPDDIDPCIYVSASGIDVDKDGIDDACDAEIGEPPLILPSYQSGVGIVNTSVVNASRPLQAGGIADRFSIVPIVDFATNSAISLETSPQDSPLARQMDKPVYMSFVSVVVGAIVCLAGFIWWIWVKIRSRKYHEK